MFKQDERESGVPCMLGLIGGSGIYEIDGLQKTQWKSVTTPWGRPSDDLLIGQLNGLDIAFLPRHGRGHVHSPSEINYRANINALKHVGVTHLLGISACGSLREDYAPGDFVLVDQFVDRTYKREPSFFGTGCVAHVSLAQATCTNFSDDVEKAIKANTPSFHRGATCIVIEGPQYSTLAESKLYRSWNMDLIGMTSMPEAKLAKEAELHYVNIAMVTDYDCWHPTHHHVDLSQVTQTLTGLVKNIKNVIQELSRSRFTTCNQGCDKAMQHTIVTAKEKRVPRWT